MTNSSLLIGSTKLRDYFQVENEGRPGVLAVGSTTGAIGEENQSRTEIGVVSHLGRKQNLSQLASACRLKSGWIVKLCSAIKRIQNISNRFWLE